MGDSQADPLVVLVAEIATSRELVRLDWTEFAVVLTLDRLGRLVNISGYAFGEKQTPNGFLPDYDELEGAVAAYLHGLYGDSPYPVRVLIQWSRVSGRVEVSFEDEDESRWKVTPQNYLVAREELRPKLAPTPTESQSDRTRRVSGEVFVWGN